MPGRLHGAEADLVHAKGRAFVNAVPGGHAEDFERLGQEADAGYAVMGVGVEDEFVGRSSVAVGPGHALVDLDEVLVEVKVHIEIVTRQPGWNAWAAIPLTPLLRGGE